MSDDDLGTELELSMRTRDLGEAASHAQRMHVRLSLLQLGLIVAASVVAALGVDDSAPPPYWQGIVTAALFGTSLLVRALVVSLRHGERWRLLRGDAERAKSLCFAFAFGATGFERGLDDAVVLRRLDDACSGLREVISSHPHDDRSFYAEATDGMLRRRGEPFLQTRERYHRERVVDQEVWLSSKSHRYARTARWLLVFTVLVELLGLLFALLSAWNWSLNGVIGIMTTVAAAALAWSQSRQFTALAASYAEQALRLRAFARQLGSVDEEHWPAFVTLVEESFGAEAKEWTRLMDHDE